MSLNNQKKLKNISFFAKSLFFTFFIILLFSSCKKDPKSAPAIPSKGESSKNRDAVEIKGKTINGYSLSLAPRKTTAPEAGERYEADVVLTPNPLNGVSPSNITGKFIVRVFFEGKEIFSDDKHVANKGAGVAFSFETSRLLTHGRYYVVVEFDGHGLKEETVIITRASLKSLLDFIAAIKINYRSTNTKNHLKRYKAYITKRIAGDSSPLFKGLPEIIQAATTASGPFSEFDRFAFNYFKVRNWQSNHAKKGSLDYKTWEKKIYPPSIILAEGLYSIGEIFNFPAKFQYVYKNFDISDIDDTYQNSLALVYARIMMFRSHLEDAVINNGLVDQDFFRDDPLETIALIKYVLNEVPGRCTSESGLIRESLIVELQYLVSLLKKFQYNY